MAAGEGKAGAVPTFSFTASEAGTNGTIPELETESANGATTGEELPAMVERVCGDLENIRIDRMLITRSSHDRFDNDVRLSIRPYGNCFETPL